MAASSTLLCIHRDPGQLSLLKENGYKLVTATNNHDGLQLCRSHAIDAIVLEYQLGPLDGAVVASEIKQIRPKVPIVMVVDSLELPEGALKSVDAVVAKSDGVHFLWAAVDFVVNVKPSQNLDQVRQGSRRGTARLRKQAGRSEALAPVLGDKERPFSPELWQGILNGIVRF